MPRKFLEKEIIIASHNPGKVREIRKLLEPFCVKVISAGELGLPEPVENGITFTDNSIIKAISSAKGAGVPALADDSGLSIHSLNGDPGVYSARWAGPKKDFSLAMEKIQIRLKKFEDKSAHFTCALSLAWPDGHTENFNGEVYGEITWPPRGENGFGYDPIFIANGMNETFAELEPKTKHMISHRSIAFKKLILGCFEPT